MPLVASCPRCTAPAPEIAGSVHCDVHGVVPALWRPTEVGFAELTEVVNRARPIPILLPWPMGQGWSIADFGCVHEGATATTTTTVGTSDLDGDVEVTVISEDPGVGLGARCAGTPSLDPGEQIGQGPATVRVRAAGRPVALWFVDADPALEVDSAAADGDPLSRAVFAGEAGGRWLWLVVRPASAAFLLQDDWLLADASTFDADAFGMPFGGRRPTW